MNGAFQSFLLPLLGAAILSSAGAFADDDVLRCGSKLVSPGVDMQYVLDQCGEPTSRAKETVPQLGRRQNGTTFETGTLINIERWTYARSSSKFPALLKFEEGKLVSIEFVHQ